MSKKNLLFYLTLILCSTSLYSFKSNELSKPIDKNNIYKTNLKGDDIITITEDYWKNEVYPSQNGLPKQQINEELLFGSDSEIIDEDGNKVILGDYDEYDVEELEELESQLDKKELIKENVEILRPQDKPGKKDYFTDDFDLIDFEGYEFLESDFSEEEMKQIKDEIFGDIDNSKIINKGKVSDDKNLKKINKKQKLNSYLDCSNSISKKEH
jgi:hypothetical protein